MCFHINYGSPREVIYCVLCADAADAKSSFPRINHCTLVISVMKWLKPRPVIAPLSGLFPLVKLAAPCEDAVDRHGVWKEETGHWFSKWAKLSLHQWMLFPDLPVASSGSKTQPFPSNQFSINCFGVLFSVLLHYNNLDISRKQQLLRLLRNSGLCWTPPGSAWVSQGSHVVTQGFCTYISSSLVISLPAAL